MRNLKRPILGCGGIFALIGLILLIIFQDEIGADVFIFGIWLMASIVLFWGLSHLYQYFRNRNFNK